MDIYKLLGNNYKLVEIIRKIILIIIIFAYVGYFVTVGYDLYNTSSLPPMQKILYGVLLAGLMLVVLFISHFSGGADFNLKYIIVLIGLACGGALIGLVGRAYQSFVGWMIAGIFGYVIIQ